MSVSRKIFFLEKSNKGTQVYPALNDIFSKPFQISISLRVDIYQEIEIMEFQEYETNEDKDEDEETPTITKSFKPDKCVICLSNEPNILFSNCNHICICLECEEVNPLNSCPYCRSNVIKKKCI